MSIQVQTSTVTSQPSDNPIINSRIGHLSQYMRHGQYCQTSPDKCRQVLSSADKSRNVQTRTVTILPSENPIITLRIGHLSNKPRQVLTIADKFRQVLTVETSPKKYKKVLSKQVSPANSDKYRNTDKVQKSLDKTCQV
jgi:hypothetical protein